MYCTINLIIFCLTSGDLSSGIYLSCSLVIVSELFCAELLETFGILLAILLLIKSLVASAVFLITLLKLVLSVSIADCLA